MIPFIKTPEVNTQLFLQYLTDSINKRHYSNFGPNEVKLTHHLEALIGASVVCCANATLALDGLHTIMKFLGSQTALLPTFTFPATNLGCQVKYSLAPSFLENSRIGYANFDNQQADYAITTAPFGAISQEVKRPNVSTWIVDNAAGATPSMDRVKYWLSQGADAVVVSLHATKSLSACEGGFIAFKNQQLYDLYRKYINFGFYFDENNQKKTLQIGSNHKMSELSAAWALMSLQHFEQDHIARTRLAQKYAEFCLSKNIPHIHSTQAFWILCPREAHLVAQDLKNIYNIETRPYYTPLFGSNHDLNSLTLEQYGLCLPTWDMSHEQIDLIIQSLNEVLS
jgi:dTDP-4-amino-4,6-dideoxygalactose transaminase